MVNYDEDSISLLTIPETDESFGIGGRKCEEIDRFGVLGFWVFGGNNGSVKVDRVVVASVDVVVKEVVRGGE